MYTTAIQKRLKTVRLPFAIRLPSIHDRWDAAGMDWIIRSEKILLVRTAAAAFEKNCNPFND